MKEKKYLKRTDETGLNADDIHTPWIINGDDVILSGRLDTLLDYLNPPTTLDDNAFSNMFKDNTSITTANIVMPNIISEHCYEAMFSACTGLVNAPSLPSTTLTDNCYYQMFMNCNALLHAPGNDTYTKLLPAQTDMFTGATNVQTDIPWCQIPTSFGGGGGTLPYFTITNSTSVTPVWTTPGDPLQYKLGDADWINANSETIITTNDIIRFRGTGRTGLFDHLNLVPWIISGTGVTLSGRLDALLDYVTPPTSLGNYAFMYMLANNESIISANLTMPQVVSSECYSMMFHGCTSLMNAPTILPATTLVNACYIMMFMDCNSLVNAPSLPATTLADECYESMFQGCSGLLHAPGNDAYTKLSPAQEDMFTGATNVQTDIPWGNIPESFGGGSSPDNYFTITNSTSVTPTWTTSGVPLQYKLGGNDWIYAVSGTSISTGNIIWFRGTGRTGLYNNINDDPWVINGTDIVISGRLDTLLDYGNAFTILGDYAFANMLKDNTSIISANIVMPQVVSDSCYGAMFKGCSSLLNAPSLPATTLVTGCYEEMLMNCSGLLHAPGNGDYTALLPAQADMFTGATNVTDDIPWIDIPESFGGGAVPDDYFTITNSTSVTPKWTTSGVPLQYKLGGNAWTDAVSGTSIITHNQFIKFRGTGRTGLYNNINDDPWVINGTGVVLLGHIDTLLDYETAPTSLDDYAFNSMFMKNTSIISANIVMPDIISDSCYGAMFKGCSSLLNAPSLPATTLAYNCYGEMFKGCTDLVNAPSLLATKLTENCYDHMFMDCTKLVDAPSLPAITLTDNCYNSMFSGCISLVNAPSLHATTLEYRCYENMFKGCNSLEHASGNGDYTRLLPAQSDMFKDAVNTGTDIPWELIPVSFGGGGGSVDPYFTITNSTSVTPTWATPGDPLQYKLGNADWVNAVSSSSISTGDVIRFRGTGRTGLYNSFIDNAWVISGNDVIISGRLDALLDYQNPPTSLGDYAFNNMLKDNTPIISVNIMMPHILSDYCYYTMFAGCNKLVNAPSLPATTLTQNCYQAMFMSCTSLVDAPSLPATTLVTGCYNYMFTGCSSLVNAPSLPATTLTDECYINMFYGCTSLVNAPRNDAYTKLLPAQAGMFTDAVNVETDIPWIEIPASFGGGGRTDTYFTITNSDSVTPTWTTPGDPLQYQLGSGDWFNAVSNSSISTGDVIRFRGTGRTGLYTSFSNNAWVISGTGVIISGNLDTVLDWQNPPTILWNYAFAGMFKGNASITNANIIMPQSIPTACYFGMFQDCTSLVNTPVLPATTLTNYCYNQMFQGCTGLLHAPGNNDYTQLKPTQTDMFTGATNVQTDIPWCQIPTSFGGGGNCPYFIITNSTDVTPTWATAGDPLQYKLGSNDWVNAVSGTSITTGDVIRFRGTGRIGLYVDDTLNPWVISGNGVIISGRLDAVLDYNTPPTSLGDYAFNKMFMNNSSIISVNIIMPNILSNYCYNSMFSFCTGLVDAPSLPATTLTYNCYNSMFSFCTGLVDAPSLPATTLADSCYLNMFQDCSGLLHAPSLPVTTLAIYCYYGMFSGCTALVKAPTLPATTLVDSCYIQMFQGCTNLFYAPGNENYTRLLPAQTDMFTGAVNIETGIPWCVIPVSFGGGGGNCPYFTIINSTDVTPTWTTSGGSIQYKLGSGGWNNATSGTMISTGMIIRFRGTGRIGLYDSIIEYYPWVISGNDVIISGRLDALLDYQNPPTSLVACAFNNMLKDNTPIISANIMMPNILSEYCYWGMFAGCTALVDAPSLPATTLAVNCYDHMFMDCTKLVDAPSLPATTLAEDCYVFMFTGCSSLHHAPGNGDYTQLSPSQDHMFTDAKNVRLDIPWMEIPVSFGGGGSDPHFTITNSTSVTPIWTTIGGSIQYRLGSGTWVNAVSGTSITTNDVIKFRGTGRTGLFTSVDRNNAWAIEGENVVLSGLIDTLLDYENPPTILGDYAFADMFLGNASITQANIIMPQTLSTSCYHAMLGDCTSLVDAPSLPVTILAEDCYSEMFSGCTSLVNAPDLRATTLANYCYQNMFYNCKMLVDAPSLPATTLTDNCYNSMFYDCTGLVDAPSLPATTLAESCYSEMFWGCTGLVNAPSLPVTTLATYCYYGMFASCTSLVNAPVLPATTLVDHCYMSMFQGCIGLVHAPGNADYTQLLPAQGDMFTGAPNVQTDIPWCMIPVSFGGLGGSCGALTIAYSTSVTPTWQTLGPPLQYKLGDDDWINATSGTRITTNEVINFRGTGRNSLYNDVFESTSWSINGTGVIISGRLDAVLDYENPPTSLGDYAFYQMFMNNPSITNTYIVMPDIVSGICYEGMFQNCINLVNAPQLPATTLENYCYTEMFSGCTSLTTAPSLPATTLTQGCYQSMFLGCTKLVNAPALPATTLTDHCYNKMFSGCTSLYNAPGNGDYTQLSPAQADMFKDATKIETDIRWSIIPESFGGGGENGSSSYSKLLDKNNE